jgi:hypothetical protein
VQPTAVNLERIGSTSLGAMTLRLACESICICFEKYKLRMSAWRAG